MGTAWPPKLALAVTVNRTVALPLPAGLTETIRNDLTENVGPPRRLEVTHDRWAGSTVRATAAGSLRPSAAQNAATACPAAAACAGVSEPETGGADMGGGGTGSADMDGAGTTDEMLPFDDELLMLDIAPPKACDMLTTCAAGGADTLTGTPKS